MGTPTPNPVSTRLERIAQLAKQGPTMAFRTLAHHIDHDLLREAFRRVRKDGASGVDGQTAADFEANLEENLQSLIDRMHTGRYRAPPVRRVHIPKGNGETRPLGIPTFEDKVLQKAVTMVLEAIYEQDFLGCSYGFRPNRSAHHALASFRGQAMSMNGCWVLEVDLRKFFDTVVHKHLKELLSRRVRDGVLVRLIHKWLKAGVMENGNLRFLSSGTPQGGVISPLLANVYLHYVLDEWFAREVQPRLRGRSFMVRYADDFVMGFADEQDARRVMEVLAKRCGKYGLELHPEKTRLIDFRRPQRTRDDDDGFRPGTFDLLGFTHHWGKSRTGVTVIKQKTMQNRFARGLHGITEWCRRNRHTPVAYQHAALCRKLTGHYGYYGLPGNWEALSNFFFRVTQIWRRWLNRRSHRPAMPWARFTKLLRHYRLPRPKTRPLPVIV